ncbi:MAG TPA: DUF2071 domain-containing protein [Bacteroidia bacterium]|nr:DUF2071 domain-containing protein [Bacteroidia bacterium]
MASPFLTAEWRKLILINYVINAHHLVPYIPYGTVLDTYNDTCYVSVVGFMFLDSTIKGIPIPFHQDFEEVNFRFYVKRQTKNGAWRRGVVFIKEFVPKVMVSAIAKYVYKENYETLEMDHTWKEREETIEVEYTLASLMTTGKTKNISCALLPTKTPLKFLWPAKLNSSLNITGVTPGLNPTKPPNMKCGIRGGKRTR